MLQSNFYDDLANKKILVVGASQGIGLNLVHALAGQNSHVVAASSNVSELDGKLATCSKFVKVPIDFQSPESIAEFPDKIDAVDGVAIVSGKTVVCPPHLMSLKNVEQQTNINFLAPLLLVSSLLRKRKISKPGSIVFTSASARINQVPCSAAYAGTKLGLIGAAKSLAADLGKKKIRVNCVSFDYVDTNMIKEINVSKDNGTLGVSPVGFTAIPYLYLLSDRSRWITGQIVAADAGRMLGKTRYV